MVRFLLSAGADLNTTSEKGQTALTVAALVGRTDCCRVLIAAGANVHHANKAGDTALVLAQAKGHDECAQVLQ